MKLLVFVSSLLALNCVRIANGENNFVGIKNGEYAHPDEAPFQVMVFQQLKSGGTPNICGGILISANKVLTAAHCLNRKEGPISIRYAVVDVSTIRYPDIKVIKARVHPNFNDTLHVHDLAVLVLRERIRSRRIKFATLRKSEVPIGTTVQIYGWGIEKMGDKKFQLQLRKTKLKIIEVLPNQLIASSPVSSSCDGDS